MEILCGAYKSTWIKVCRKTNIQKCGNIIINHENYAMLIINYQKLMNTNKSWELYDVHNIQFGNVIYQDLTCLLWYEKIINNWIIYD